MKFFFDLSEGLGAASSPSSLDAQYPILFCQQVLRCTKDSSSLLDPQSNSLGSLSTVVVYSVLAYLLSVPFSALPEVGSHHRTSRILFGGRTTDEGDEEHLQRFSRILLNLEKSKR